MVTAARVRYKLVSFVPAADWLRVSADDARIHVRDFSLRSPRGPGRFRIDTVAMPADMGTFDVERLRRLMARDILPPRTRSTSTLDAWMNDGITCVARSAVSRPDAFMARMLEQKDFGSTMNEEMRAEMKAFLAEPTYRRDWLLAGGSDMANVWYRGTTPDNDVVAADLTDCEDMVRSIRFDV